MNAGREGVEVKGTFNAQTFFETLAAILSERERVQITVMVTKEPAQPEKAAG